MKYDKAEKFVHSLKLNSLTEWRKFTESKQFPINMPKAPWSAYRNVGWVSAGKWLGTGKM